jgi:hypothetical protein
MWQKPNALLQCKKFLKVKFLGILAIDIEHGPHWLNFTILTFINENDTYFKGLYKIWNKIIWLDMRKIMKCNTNHGESERKVNLGVLGMNPCVFQMG